jgi:N-acetylmuramoyl-L-alanine amidase
MKKIPSLISIIVAIVLSNVNPVLAGKLTQWNYSPEKNQLEFTLEKTTTPNYFLLENPARIVIDLPNVQLGNVTTRENYTGKVREIRLSQFTEEVTRLVVELLPEVKITPEQISLQKIGDNRWILSQKFDNVTVTVPPLQPRDQLSLDETDSPSSPIIQFGQPLPSRNINDNPNSKNNQTTFPKRGTKIMLRYEGEKILTLIRGKITQEVLVLAEEIYLNQDMGNILIPKGSAVIGSFETQTNGDTFFLTQAISIEGQNFPLQARSPILPLKNNMIEEASLTQTVSIEPGLIVQVELTEDWGY